MQNRKTQQYDLAYRLFADHDYQNALHVMQEQINSNRSNQFIAVDHIFIARCHIQLNEINQALTKLKEISGNCKKPRDKCDLNVTISNCYKALYIKDLDPRNLELAKKYLNEIDSSTLDDKDKIQLQLHKVILLTRAKEGQAALKIILELEAKDPENKRIQLEKVKVLRLIGNKEAAQKLAEDLVLSNTQTPDSSKTRDQYQYKVERSNKYLLKTAALYTKNPDIMNQFGQQITKNDVYGQVAYAISLAKQKNGFDEADALLNEIIKDHPFNWPAYLSYAVVLLEHHLYDESINILQKVIRPDRTIPTNSQPTNPQKASACHIMSNVYLEWGNPEEEKRYIDFGLSISPHDASLLSKRAKMLAQTQKSKHYGESGRADPSRLNRLHGEEKKPENKVSVVPDFNDQDKRAVSSSTRYSLDDLIVVNPKKMPKYRGKHKRPINAPAPELELELSPVVKIAANSPEPFDAFLDQQKEMELPFAENEIKTTSVVAETIEEKIGKDELPILKAESENKIDTKEKIDILPDSGTNNEMNTIVKKKIKRAKKVAPDTSKNNETKQNTAKGYSVCTLGLFAVGIVVATGTAIICAQMGGPDGPKL